MNVPIKILFITCLLSIYSTCYSQIDTISFKGWTGYTSNQKVKENPHSRRNAMRTKRGYIPKFKNIRVELNLAILDSISTPTKYFLWVSLNYNSVDGITDNPFTYQKFDGTRFRFDIQKPLKIIIERDTFIFKNTIHYSVETSDRKKVENRRGGFTGLDIEKFEYKVKERIFYEIDFATVNKISNFKKGELLFSGGRDISNRGNYHFGGLLKRKNFKAFSKLLKKYGKN